MIDLKKLDQNIAHTMENDTVLSHEDLKYKLDKQFIDIGLNWYIKEKYLDYVNMDKPRHRYSSHNHKI